MSMKSEPDDDLEEGYTLEYILRERGYSPEVIAERQRRKALRDDFDESGEASTTESVG
jgi:hypothetical protein